MCVYIYIYDNCIISFLDVYEKMLPHVNLRNRSKHSVVFTGSHVFICIFASYIPQFHSLFTHDCPYIGNWCYTWLYFYNVQRDTYPIFISKHIGLIAVIISPYKACPYNSLAELLSLVSPHSVFDWSSIMPLTGTRDPCRRFMLLTTWNSVIAVAINSLNFCLTCGDACLNMCIIYHLEIITWINIQ